MSKNFPLGISPSQVKAAVQETDGCPVGSAAADSEHEIDEIKGMIPSFRATIIGVQVLRQCLDCGSIVRADPVAIQFINAAANNSTSAPASKLNSANFQLNQILTGMAHAEEDSVEIAPGLTCSILA